MNAEPTLSDLAPPDQEPDDAAYFAKTLRGLVKKLDIVATLIIEEAQANAAAPKPAPRSACDFAAPLDRVVRAIRLTVALDRKIAERRPARLTPAQRTTARKKLIRAVEDHIHSEAREREATDRLHEEFAERLNDPELDIDLAIREVEDVVTEICRDLGLGPTKAYFQRRTPMDLAALRDHAAYPSTQPLVYRPFVPDPYRSG